MVCSYFNKLQHSNSNLTEISKTNDPNKKLIDVISENFVQIKEKVYIALLNDMLDPLKQKFYEKNKKSKNQKNCKTKEKILCTCNINEIKKMTHNYISGFDVVYIRELSNERQFVSTLSSIVAMINNSYVSKSEKKYLMCINRSNFAGEEKYLYANILEQRLSKYCAENCDIYLWDSSIHHPSSITEDFLYNAPKRMNSELIADICEQSSIRENLIIFTGGGIDAKSIDTNDERMKSNGIKFNYVYAYIIGGDLSVSASYARKCPSITYIESKDKTEQINFTKEDMFALNGITNISTYNEFNSKYSNLRNAIQAKTLGTKGDKELLNKLSSISPIIRKSCNSIHQKSEFDDKMKSLQNMALGALRSVFRHNSIESVFEKFGNEVAFDKKEAANFFQITANKNDINSMINYANMLIRGDYIPINKQEAICYYKRAIDNDSTTAMVQYANALYYGKGIQINKQEASKYYKKAADNKKANAMLKYAEMLYFGDGIPINKPEACRYYKMAAENGFRIDFFGSTFCCFSDIANSHGSSGNLWCIDCSGSVGGCELYHEQLKLLLSKYRQENDDFYFWDDNYYRSSSIGVDIFTSLKLGQGGTRSEYIADICEQSTIRDHLIIVTDGCVFSGSIDKSDMKMKKNNIVFKHVTTYIIGSDGDLSVGAPYSRRCPNITYKVEKLGVEVPQIALTQEDIRALEKITSIETYNQFTGQYSHLNSAIKAKTLGTDGDVELQEQIMTFAGKIKKSCKNKSERKDTADKIRTIENMSIGALRNAFTPEDIENNVNKPPEEIVKNNEKAIQIFKKFAEKGDVDAMVTYANIKLNDDKSESANFFKKAADTGNETAILKYADMLRTGDGIPVNREESARYFKKAADIGNVTASLAYAFMVKLGDGVSVNKEEAAHYFKQAADNGGSKEKLFYAYMLKNGDGIPANKTEADKYFKLAASEK